MAFFSGKVSSLKLSTPWRSRLPTWAVAAFTAVKAPCSVVCSVRRERYISTLSVKTVNSMSFSSSSKYLAILMAASMLQTPLMPRRPSFSMVSLSTPRLAR